MKRLASYSMRQLRGETFWSNCAQNAHTAACKTNSFGKKTVSEPTAKSREETHSFKVYVLFYELIFRFSQPH